MTVAPAMPATGAAVSRTRPLPPFIQEMPMTTTSECQGRPVDTDQGGSMETKTREGHFRWAP